jgi:methylase of polypeptide subunit release factors
MIGRSTAPLYPHRRRRVQEVWGIPDIHTRQKWMAVWPHLRRLPKTGLRFLDAGCGTGVWAMEIAARRPNWTVEGIDHDPAAIDQAETARARLGLANVKFAYVVTGSDEMFSIGFGLFSRVS